MTEAGRARHLKQLAWLIFTISVLAPGLSHLVVEHTQNTWFATLIADIGLGLFSFYLFYRSRQYAALARKRVATTLDARAPVLYLRPFSRDMTALKAAFLLQHKVSGSLEEQLRDAVAPIGPLVSIAIPGEQLPPVGAHRIHMADNEWQAKVDTLMQSAALVIILVGKGGAGLGWEIQRAFDTVDRNRLLLLVTRGKQQYELSVEGIERASGVKLPTYRSINRIVGPNRFTGANCFLSFPREGETVVLKLRAPFLRGFGVFTAEARYALKPFFEMHGFSWTMPPILIGNVIGAVAFVALVLVLIFV